MRWYYRGGRQGDRKWADMQSLASVEDYCDRQLLLFVRFDSVNFAVEAEKEF